MNFSWLGLSLFAALILGIVGDRSDDCTEVGYARSAGSNVPTAYDTVKERVLQQWHKEEKTGQPPYTHFSSALKNVTRSAFLLEEVSKEVLAIIKKTRVGKRCQEEWLLRGLEKHVQPVVQLDPALADQLGLVMSFRCMVGSPYPNVDGSCVSEESPDLGAIGAKFLRLIPSRPGLDGFSLRGSVREGEVLPSARAAAQVIRKLLVAPPVTPLFAAWSHFVQQDIFNIPESPLSEGVDCCQSPTAGDCAPILVPEDDPLYPTTECFNFRRSARAQAILGHRESFSLVSTYLDATPLYGPTNEEAFKRKTGFFGYLKGPERLECDEGDQCGCTAPESLENCFQPSEDDSLTVASSLRALLLLEHNRIADVLAELNPHFDDALLYNEARRISIGQYDSLTYGSFLPVLMGEDTVKKHFLQPGAEGPAASYIKEVNPGVLTSYAAAAFRNPAMETEWRLDQSGREEVFGSNHYSSVDQLPYQDLLAADVQRARDHGLPGYIAWRRFCEPGLVLDSWQDLEKIFPAATVEALKLLYRDQLEDMDAMVALLEPPVEGGVAGKTFTCIMADQFARLRTGNRLFWEHDAALLTREQREELLTASLPKLLCANLPLIKLPANPFLPVSPQNPEVECSDMSPLNLTLWTDKSLIESMKAVKRAEETGDSEASLEKIAAAEDEKKSSGDGAGQTRTSPQSSSSSSSSSSSGVVAEAAEAARNEPTARMGGAPPADGQQFTATTETQREEL